MDADTSHRLDDDIADACARFLARHGDQLLDPDAVRGWCNEVSEKFVADLRAADVPAEVVSGLEIGEIAEFPGVELVLNGHYAVLVPEGFDGKEWVGQVVVDWTARQFDPAAPVPLVQSLADWRTRWRAHITGDDRPAV